MSCLNYKDVQTLLNVIAGLQEQVTLEDFGAHLIKLMENFLPGAIVAFDEIELDGSAYRISHNHPMDEATNQRMFARLQEVYKQNPIYNYFRQGGTESVVKISDLAPQEKIRRTDFYNDILKPVGVQYQVNMMVPTEGCLSTLTINMEHDFKAEHIEMLGLLSRHLRLGHLNARTFSELQRLRNGSSSDTHESGLSGREVELLHWIREGKRNKEIAVILGVSPRTVEKHVENILRKLGVETRTAAIQTVFSPSARKVPIRHGIHFTNGHSK